jgi:anti-sigma B factor antagonist
VIGSEEMGLVSRGDDASQLLAVWFDTPAPGVLAAHLSGEPDVSTARTLDEFVSARLARAKPPRRLVLDLADLRFIDLQGVAVLARALRRAVAAHTRFRLATVPPIVVHTLKFAGILAMFERIPDVSHLPAIPPRDPGSAVPPAPPAW